MLQISNFVSTYYVCSLGEALSVYNPFNKRAKNLSHPTEKFDSKIQLSILQEKAKDFRREKTSTFICKYWCWKNRNLYKIMKNILNQNEQAVLLIQNFSNSSNAKN